MSLLKEEFTEDGVTFRSIEDGKGVEVIASTGSKSAKEKHLWMIAPRWGYDVADCEAVDAMVSRLKETVKT